MRFIVISASFPWADGRRLNTKLHAIRHIRWDAPLSKKVTDLASHSDSGHEMGLSRFWDGALGLAFERNWCFNFCGRLAGFLISSRQGRRENERRVQAKPLDP